MNRNFPLSARNPAEAELRQVFDRFFGLGTEDDQSVISTTQWAPRVDVHERPDQFLISADIPGVDPKDIEVHMENGVLTVRGERHNETKEEGETFSRRERTYGSFYRRFALPDTADAERVSAKGKNGVLEISIPKKPVAMPRKIAVE